MFHRLVAKEELMIIRSMISVFDMEKKIDIYIWFFSLEIVIFERRIFFKALKVSKTFHVVPLKKKKSR